jgi:hypothetical protein
LTDFRLSVCQSKWKLFTDQFEMRSPLILFLVSRMNEKSIKSIKYSFFQPPKINIKIMLPTHSKVRWFNILLLSLLYQKKTFFSVWWCFSDCFSFSLIENQFFSLYSYNPLLKVWYLFFKYTFYWFKKLCYPDQVSLKN